MTQTITRLYDSSSKLGALEAELKKNGFDCTIVQGGRSAAGDVVTALRQAGVSRKEASIYADYLKKSGVVVAVKAAFGLGTKAEAILESL